jgi:XisI protein
MDKLKKYQKAILEILNEYSKIKYANIEGENQVIADKENHRYQVVTIGWEDNVFINDCPLRFDIIKDKIWIQQNSTEWDVGKMLMDLGVPKSDIVLGFLKPSTRALTDYAVA